MPDVVEFKPVRARRSVSASRPMCRSAWPVSAASPSAAAGANSRNSWSWRQYLAHRFPNVSRQQNAPQAQGELHYHDTIGAPS
jgi:hypothetical protein